MNAYDRYRRARREQDPVYQQWRATEARHLMVAVLVVASVAVSVFALVLLTS